jgi:ADP-ribose pyrophosphatase YjhB (NUDIX family)
VARRRRDRFLGGLSKQIRPLALAVVRDGDRLLVYQGHDPIKDETFYRPLGGGIEFGERGADAVARELREELGATVRDARFLGVLENVFTYAGQPGHEIALMYGVALAEPVAHGTRVLDDEGEAIWMPLSAFREGGSTLYPDGLLELLDNSANAR